MKTTKRTLSMLLALCMLLSMFPLSVLNVNAAPAAETDPDDYTDVDMDFSYPYSNPMDVLKQQAKETSSGMLDTKPDGEYVWKHANTFAPKSCNLRELLQSTDSDDKYIIVDKDLYTTSAHTDYQTIVIKSDKVLDLNGKTIRLMDKRNKIDTHDNKYSDSYYQSSNSADFQSVMFSIENGATLTIIDSSEGLLQFFSGIRQCKRKYAILCGYLHQQGQTFPHRQADGRF